MYRTLKYSFESSNTRQLFLRSSAGCRLLCSQPPEKDPIDAEENSSSDFSAEGSTLSQPNVIQTLLALKDEPKSAFKYFRQIEGRRGFVKSIDVLCVLLHVLMTSKRFHKMAQNLLNEAISGDILPDSSSVVARFFDCATKFRYDLDFRVFSYLLSSYVRAEKIENAIDCFDKLIENGVIPCKIATNGLLSALVRRNLIGQAQELYPKMKCDAASVDIMMRGCLKQGELDKADDYFFQAKESGIELDQRCYALAIYILCRKQISKLAFELLMEMRDKNWVPYEDTYSHVIGACVKQGNIVDAFKVRDEMLSSGQPINLVAATSLIKGYCILGDIDRAIDMFQNLGHLVPNSVTFSVLIEGCCKNKRVSKAHEIYSQMKAMKIQPSVYNVNSLIHAYLGENSLEDGLKVLEEAVDMGIANVFTYNYVLSWLCKEGRVTETLSLWEKMVSRGVSPSVVSYNNLILLHCKDKNMETAFEAFSDMVPNGLNPNVNTYSVLIDGYFKNGMTEQALAVMDQMELSKLVPSDVTMNTVINGWCKSGQSMIAKCWLEQNDEGFVPICLTYNSIIAGFIKEGNMETAISTFEEMCINGVLPNVVTYTTLIKGLCKKSMDLARKMWDRMKEDGIEADVKAYNVLIEGYCQNRDMETALKLYSELLETGLSPNKVIYNSLMGGYRNVENIDAAIRLYSKMIEEGVGRDLQTYTTLIDGLLKEGKLESALDLYAVMISDGVKADGVFFTVLINGLCKKGQVENARWVLKEMEKNGVGGNVMMYNALIAGYFKEGDLVEAFRLHDEMVDRDLVPDASTYNLLISGRYKGEKLLPHSFLRKAAGVQRKRKRRTFCSSVVS